MVRKMTTVRPVIEEKRSQFRINCENVGEFSGSDSDVVNEHFESNSDGGSIYKVDHDRKSNADRGRCENRSQNAMKNSRRLQSMYDRKRVRNSEGETELEHLSHNSSSQVNQPCGDAVPSPGEHADGGTKKGTQVDPSPLGMPTYNVPAASTPPDIQVG